MRNVSDKIAEEIKTHILCSITFFPEKKKWRLYNNLEEYGGDSRPQTTI